MDEYSKFSSLEKRIGNIPQEMNPNDILDFSNYPRDSFINQSNNKYFNNNNYKSPF